VLNYESAKNYFPRAFKPTWVPANATGTPPCGNKTAAEFGGGTCASPTAGPTICQSWIDTDDPPNGTLDRPEYAHFILSYMLPFIEQRAVYQLADLKNKDWDNASNMGSADNPGPMRIDISEFLCPSAEHVSGAASSDYTVVYTVDSTGYCTDIENANLASIRRPLDSLVGMLDDKGTTTSSVADGLSHTIMFIESAGRPFIYRNGEVVGELVDDNAQGRYIHWASRDLFSIFGKFGTSSDCKMTSAINCENTSDLGGGVYNNQIYSFHNGGANIVLGDGSVTFMSETTDPDVVVSLITRNAGDKVEAL
jgi:prepilin-type processing-associated H-X9-DG protein